MSARLISFGARPHSLPLWWNVSYRTIPSMRFSQAWREGWIAWMRALDDAGKTGAPKISEVELDVWTSVITINLTAPMLLCQEALPLMRLAGGGSIVNVASRVYLSGTGIGYTSSKAG